jgi:hypothetical protein
VPEGTSLGQRRQQEITAPIEKVAKIITKAMKPGRRIVSAVKFSDGTVQEIIEGEYDDATPLPERGAPYRQPAKQEPRKESKPEAGASVPRPYQGCPAPDFENADVKATRVLRTFLTPEQREDWDRHNRFIAVGAITGHRYMVTSRYATDSLALYHRSLYDLDERRPLCVHDWDVPAAEEALAIGLLVQLPDHEEYLRHLEA